ncbi:hypothetical protein F5878DRAFT_610142 [Lentinula raphanica]|uniref:Ubiquitin-like domain-containing protein n=1 Tax=Lentinula raphanica TaxID=153919 RepID=A0AA38UGZ5_9AGAR|nr:hypothetical protein F5878DRAFT_610142 [Lentinula raphanica]
MLKIYTNTTVRDVKTELRRRRLISDPTNRRTHLITAPTRLHPLQDNERLYEIGIENMMTIHVRNRLLGGAPASERHTFDGARTRFTPATGVFPSKHPEMWEAHPTEPGKFRCIPCNEAGMAEFFLTRNLRRHENSQRHIDSAQYWKDRQEVQPHHSQDSRTRMNVHDVISSILVSSKHSSVAKTSFQHRSPSPSVPDIDMDAFNMAWNEETSVEPERPLPPEFVASLEEYLNFEDNPDQYSDEEEEVERSEDEEAEEYLDTKFPNLFLKRRAQVNADPNSTYFPWPDRETCVLDILRHIPRCAFSRKQNLAIHWAMVALGVPNLPSDRTMDDVDRELQKICGIQTHRYEGKLGHVYYVNDMAGIIAQEMSNPRIRPHLHFLPEDSGNSLAEAYQAERWLKEQDPELLTPVHHAAGQDFFSLEPALLSDGKTICMPSRWFRRKNKVYAKAWTMKVTHFEGVEGWAVQTHQEIEVAESNLLLAFPRLKQAAQNLNVCSPDTIVAEETSPDTYMAWGKTNPSMGNRWRKKSQGKRVVAFPIWLYCDDTSGNTSKKWNKHNSFLFTAAGLPRHLASRETNVHFLCTSNTAPPLEMLDGIVEQLEKSQSEGIWAWDAVLNDLVLVIPSVHALLGDNPMQSEFACHIGFKGLRFCRNCWVSGKVDGNHENDGQDVQDVQDGNASDTSVGSISSRRGGKPKKSAQESMKDMITRITDFMKPGIPRKHDETCTELRSQFLEASRVGGGAEFKRMKTKSGIKDTFQGVFAERLQAIATKKGLSRDTKEREIIKLKLSFPEHTTSPVWRIRGLDPHQDTPVEVLHVILLGIVKYFWRDSVNRTNNKSDRATLIARLASFNTWGLGIPPLNGDTLVNYAGSLTGRDFRAIAQAAPFALEGLISDEQLEVWKAISALVTLVWQPHIHDIEAYLAELEKTIDHLLECTCRLTPRWFNKPKFHVLLHLPLHIRRFGPAMLFATESFESFNAIIRARSVHSNRHAPSKDIAHAMARGNRIRHLLDGGRFWTGPTATEAVIPDIAPLNSGRPALSKAKTLQDWIAEAPFRFRDPTLWRSASRDAQNLLRLLDFDTKLLGQGYHSSEQEDGLLTYGRPPAGSVGSVRGLSTPFSNSIFAKSNPQQRRVCTTTSYRTCETISLQSGDEAFVNNWIVWNQHLPGLRDECTIPTIGRIVEIIQIVGSDADHQGNASYLTIQRAIAGELHPRYGMHQVELTNEFELVLPQDVLCIANVQHNCCDNKCPVKRTGSVMKEREESKEKVLRVEHIDPGSLILNTAQMRSSAYLQPFRMKIPLSNREVIIQDSVRAEIDARKQKAKADLTTADRNNTSHISPGASRQLLQRSADTRSIMDSTSITDSTQSDQVHLPAVPQHSLQLRTGQEGQHRDQSHLRDPHPHPRPRPRPFYPSPASSSTTINNTQLPSQTSRQFHSMTMLRPHTNPHTSTRVEAYHNASHSIHPHPHTNLHGHAQASTFGHSHAGSSTDNQYGSTHMYHGGGDNDFP